VAEPSLNAARYVMRVETHVQRLRSMESSFTVGTILVNDEQAMKRDPHNESALVGRNSGPVFRVCGSKFTKLCTRAQERWPFAKPFSV